MKKNMNGFSLVEMAIVLVIVGLMIGGLLTPLSMQMDQRKAGETQKALDDIREALIGFALRNGYLPCPAISALNGLEDRTDTHCSGARRQGFLPWATLGVPKLDAWNHLFRYSVTPAFSNSQVLFTLASARDISILSRDGGGQLNAASAPGDIPAVVMSHGKNGFFGSNDLGIVTASLAGGNTDEQLNANPAGTRFVSRAASDNPSGPGGTFDDMVASISPNILYSRMVTAQKLP